MNLDTGDSQIHILLINTLPLLWEPYPSHIMDSSHSY